MKNVITYVIIFWFILTLKWDFVTGDLKDYLYPSCKEQIECTIGKIHNEESFDNIDLNEFPNLRILRIMTNISIKYVNTNSNLKVIYADNYVYYITPYTNRFTWLDRKNIKSKPPYKTLRSIFWPLKYCLNQHCALKEYSHELTCNFKEIAITSLTNFVLDDSNLIQNNITMQCRNNITYVNFSGKYLVDFQFNCRITPQLRKLNLSNTTLDKKITSNTFQECYNLAFLSIGDNLLNTSIVNIFYTLKALVQLDTPNATYFRTRHIGVIEKYNRVTKCFSTISIRNETESEDASVCLKPKTMLVMDNSDLMLETYFSTLKKYAVYILSITVAFNFIFSLVMIFKE